MNSKQIKKQIEIYTDGSCLGNPGPGGWAALFHYKGKNKMISGQAMDTTNNRMELTAVIEALNGLKESCHIELFTDSKYVMDGAQQWMKNWKAKGWMRTKRDPVKNVELWQALDQAMVKHRINWHWVKGHSGHIENDLVDEEARRQAELVNVT
jgi:ribonuclease HI